MILDSIKKFIFPSRCIICDTVLPYGDKLENEYLCTSCRKNIEFIKGKVCKKCGAMLGKYDDELCERCKTDLHKNYEYGFGLLRYNDFVKDSLHKRINFVKYLKDLNDKKNY